MMRNLAYTPLAAAAASLALLAGSAFAQNTSFDVEVNFGYVGENFYITSFDPPGANVGATGTGNLNPTIELQMGQRYRFNNPDQFLHPFALIADGVSNDLLLRQSATGTLESDPGIDWHQDGAFMYFTLSGTLADAMQDGGKTPRYICEAHYPGMAGNITFRAAATDLVWPGGIETFEDAVVGEDVIDALEGWVIAGPGPDYTAVISQSPASAPGQAPGSTRWLTVTDNDTVESNRLYSPGIIAPSTVDSYTFDAYINIESIGAGTTALIVSQHFDSPYQNLAGVEVTDAGVDLIILGTDDGGVGKAGATVRAPLYSFATANFGLGEWVQLEFEVDFSGGNLHGTATGSDGVATETNTLAGIDIQGTADPGNFRYCIRNNEAGSTSLINYDMLSFTGQGDTHVPGWHLY